MSREAFEAWVKRDSTLSVERDGEGYRDMDVYLMWRVWPVAQADAFERSAGSDGFTTRVNTIATQCSAPTSRPRTRTGMENEMTKEIEVIDQYNARHRFPVEGHYYEWRLKPGTIDVEGTDFLDVFRRYKDDEDEFEVIATFPRPARVGIVTDATCLVLPMRELQMEQCPRCGYVTKPTAEKLK